MATLKKRLNITLAPEVELIIARIAKRDQVPAATKVSELLDIALHLEEDFAWNELATARDTFTAKYVSHTVAWK